MSRYDKLIQKILCILLYQEKGYVYILYNFTGFCSFYYCASSVSTSLALETTFWS